MHLNKSGYKTVSFENATDFFIWLSPKNTPILCILDIMLPDIQGTEICRRLRKSASYSNLPVIMLSALGDETDKVTSLDLGADDYVTKPFSPKELIARVKALLRRQNRSHQNSEIIQYGPIEMNIETFRLIVNGKNIEMTSTEFGILKILLEGKGKVFSRAKLLNILWGGEKFVFERTIDVHIRNIREKLGETSKLIQNVRGIGYRADYPDV